ncbi:DUF2809 domain-containing protein [Jejudonia soesokkakensis]|uniref:DUF2809 domain-containing protein n=1 Tax=Jejudonia soesokkakensis TaxID=1323432 RepID=A0ABW2MXB3_9FLAO
MKRNLILFVLLLIAEIAIALFHFHKFVRGFIGDVLVIPLLYYFLKLLTKFSTLKTLVIVLLIAFSIEFLQLFPISETLEINNNIINIIIGTTFDPKDLLAYFIGGIGVFTIENFKK